MNKYMKYKITRLRKLRTDPDKFWRVVWYLIKYSTTFRVSAINKVFVNWYKDMPFLHILATNRKASVIINKVL
jgi:hypothetical protein